MINLLPPEIKNSYSYARRNVYLRRWVMLFAFALIGLAIIGTGGLLQLHQSTVNYQKQVENTQQVFKKEQYSQAQQRVQDISNSFKLVVKVLGQEVLFSKLIQQIAASLPAKANLTGLTIVQTTGGIDITAVTPDYNTATQVQVNLADPNNKIFTKADIVSITCKGSDAPDPTHPCTVEIRALFAPNNPFLFINSKAKS